MQLAKAATSSIPIVFVVHADPEGTGHVVSLARPGGNVTGLANADPGPEAGRCPRPPRGDGAASRARSRHAGGTLPGSGPRRRPSAGGFRATGAVDPRGGRARFRGDVAAPGLRCQPRGDAPRCRGPRGGDRGADPDDSPSAQTGPGPSGPRVSFPGLPRPLRRGASSPSLGPWRAHDALESRPAVSLRRYRHNVDGTIARCTKKASRSRVGPTGRSPSGGPTVGRYPTYRHRPQCPQIRSRRSGWITRRRGFTSPRGRGSPAGSGNRSTWCGRSTCCTRWRRQPGRRLTTPPSDDKLRTPFHGQGDPVTTRRTFLGTLWGPVLGARRALALRPLRGVALHRRRVQPGRGGLRHHGVGHLLPAGPRGPQEIRMSYRLGVDGGGTLRALDAHRCRLPAEPRVWREVV